MNRRIRKLAIQTALTTLLITAHTTPATAGTHQWQSRPPLHQARGALSVATVDGKILAIGGFKGDDVFNTVETRHTRGRGIWRKLPPMPTRRANLATATVRRTVYAAGGFLDNIARDVVEKFDLDSGHWARSHPLPEPRAMAGAAALNGLLYVAGGNVAPPGIDREITRSLIAYDPAKNTWKSVAPMLTARDRLRLVASGGYLYAVGGVDQAGRSLTTVERYDPRSDSWRTMKPMRQSRALPCLVETTVGHRAVLVVVGGAEVAEGDILVDARSTAEVFDARTNRWTLLNARLPVKRASLDCAVEADGTVLAIGGITPLSANDFAFLADVDALTVHPHNLIT